jgi:siroheme synthase-like protein
MKVYPIFLIGLQNKRCVVLGGGRDAETKVEGLLDGDAAVTVISAEATDRLRVWAEEGAITWIPRDYEQGDLQGAFLVIATPSETETHRLIWEEAEAEGALVNVMDDSPHCNFIAGSIVRQGPLAISISTSGCAPALAVRIRQRLEAEFGPEFATFLHVMEELREPMAARFSDFETRRARWYELVDSDIIDFLREGREDLERGRLAEIPGLKRRIGVTNEGHFSPAAQRD